MREKNLSEIQVVNIRNTYRKNKRRNWYDFKQARQATGAECRNWRRKEEKRNAKLFKTRSTFAGINRGAKDNGEEGRQQEKGGKERCFFLWAREKEGGGGNRGKRRERVSARRRGESPWGRNSRYSKARGGFTLHKFYRWREAVR